MRAVSQTTALITTEMEEALCATDTESKRLTSFTSCCSVWLAKCSVFRRCFCKGSSGIPLQISSPSRIAAGASNGGGRRYWDFIASGTYIAEKEDHT